LKHATNHIQQRYLQAKKTNEENYITIIDINNLFLSKPTRNRF
jgi:hypothetical protein